MERNERKLCEWCKRKLSTHTLPMVRVTKCPLEYELILCLEKKALTDTEKCERNGGELSHLKPIYLLSDGNGIG